MKKLSEIKINFVKNLKSQIVKAYDNCMCNCVGQNPGITGNHRNEQRYN